MNKYLTLPDEIIQLIKQYAMATVPFKDELLKRDFVKYHYENNDEVYKLCKPRGGFEDGCILISETKYIRIHYLVSRYDKYYMTYFTYLYQYVHFKIDTNYFTVLSYIRDTYINVLTSLNTRKELSKISKKKYNKIFSKLSKYELYEFLLWYILHYD